MTVDGTGRGGWSTGTVGWIRLAVFAVTPTSRRDVSCLTKTPQRAV